MSLLKNNGKGENKCSPFFIIYWRYEGKIAICNISHGDIETKDIN